MKFKTLTVALATLGLASQAAIAQISDDEIRLGFVTDMSSVYSDIDGPGGVEAIRLAIEDAGGAINGKKITLVFADHQSKADVASARAREWFDRENLDFLIGGTNSAAQLAMSAVAAEKHKPYVNTGAGASDMHNQRCNAYTIHYTYDTTVLARGTGSAVVKDGGKTWFFLTTDYAFGHALERDTATVVTKSGGEVLGNVRIPLNTADFSSYLLQAQASKAQILGLANAGGDTINSIRAANEFGITQTMKFAGLLVFITDVHSLGLQMTQGMYLTAGWYWDQSDAARAWAARFEAKVGRKPTMVQAGDYSIASFYLKAVRETGTDDPDTVLQWMKSNPINDMFATNGVIRKDGRMVYDMYLMQVKTPAESKYPWDYYKVVQTLPRNEVYIQPEESQCSLWKD